MIQAIASLVERIAVATALLLAAYGAAGMIGGSIASNPGWRAPANGVPIFIEANAVHSAIIVPKVAAGVDWRPVARAADLGDARFANEEYLAIGWGQHRFFLETPAWADVRLSTVLAASLGSDKTLVHVDHLPRPIVGGHVRAIVLRPYEYRRLAAFITASMKPRGRRYHGYGDWDAFYEGRGHYDALTTCNSWTGNALRYAGVRIGMWTPFPVTVLGWFGPDQGGNGDASLSSTVKSPAHHHRK